MQLVCATGIYTVNVVNWSFQVSVSKLRYFYMDGFGRTLLVSRVHPDIKEAQMRAVRHIQQAYKIPVQKV